MGFYLCLVVVMPATGAAQSPTSAVSGTVRDEATGNALGSVVIEVEGLILRARSDAQGRFRIAPVPTGPQILLARRLGYAPRRIPLVVTGEGVVQDIALSTSALLLPNTVVTADPASRARGELGTASVIGREAIANQTAASVAGVLELVPGTPLAPPGLDGVQQFAARTTPVGGGAVVPGSTAQPSAASIASFGTLILLDGVPLSNNANLQAAGARAEFGPATSAGGGIDLRRLPATTVERLEVVRGLPSARYGDLTSGAIIIDTRAGEFVPNATMRLDARTTEASLAGGRSFRAARHAGTLVLDVARTRTAPGIRDDASTRAAAQGAWRVTGGDGASGAAGGALLDTRLDLYVLRQDSPEQPEVQRGRTNWNRDVGVRVSTRARLGRAGARTELTLAADRSRQRSFAQEVRLRPALPFTDRLTEGRAIGRFVEGEYTSAYRLDGDPWLTYGRLEHERTLDAVGARHVLRAGAELRREGNLGAGYQFDVETPPQVSFNGVQGFDRPRRFDATLPLATTAAYLDDRLVRSVGALGALEVQAGARLDVLHRGRAWLSKARSAQLQPRLSAQLAPRPWLRLRASGGTVTKTPSVASLSPAPQYYDIVNVNWFVNNPAERLAVLTTFLRDPSNPALGLSRARRAEAGFELVDSRQRATLSMVWFDDRTRGAVGFAQRPFALGRDRFDFVDSTQGTGRPPTIVEPPSRTDPIPVLLDVPANNTALDSRGWELTASLPEIPRARLRAEVQGARTSTDLRRAGIDFGRTFGGFQLDERIPRAPFWEATRSTGARTIVTTRLIHHQPRLGLVITGVVQHTLGERSRDILGIDTLAWSGYVDRTGALTQVPRERRLDPQYADLRVTRTGLSTAETRRPNDWLISLQVSKTLAGRGRLSFYAFNALDRPGTFDRSGFIGRSYAPLRFGAEVDLPLGALLEVGR